MEGNPSVAQTATLPQHSRLPPFQKNVGLHYLPVSGTQMPSQELDSLPDYADGGSHYLAKAVYIF